MDAAETRDTDAEIDTLVHFDNEYMQQAYVRVYDKANSRMQDGWVMKAEDIAGLTPQEIQNKFALPNKFVYDDFEEVWESDKGVFIEMDAETNKVRWISVYVPELDLEDFEDCKW